MLGSWTSNMTLGFTPRLSRRRSLWWRELFVLALIGTGSTFGCRTQEAQPPKAEVDAEDEAELDGPDPEQESEDGAGDTRAESTDGAELEEGDETSVQEKLAIEAIGTQLARTA